MAMQRLSRRDLSDLIFVAIVTAPPIVQRGLVSKDQQARENARRALTERIIDRLDGESSMVIVAEMVGPPHLARRGRFGVDEPSPIADETPVSPCRSPQFDNG